MLKGKVALVTGGARRIGRQIALRLAEEGIDVVVNYRRSREEALETVRAITERGARGLALQADLVKLADCDSLIQKAVAEFGQIDILVNNASEFPKTPFEGLFLNREFYEGIFDQLVAIHMRAPFYLAGKIGMDMKQRGWGRIINITDRCTIKGTAYKDYGPYLITKYGLYGITQVLAEELAPEVLVNAVAPALVIAPEDFSPEEIQQIREKLPLKQEVTPEEIAEEVVHLVKSKGKTGSTILIDAGAGVRTF
ncbi:MAG TPA: SDR family oxidoreductase [Candidatus Limnocylindrales bacterium]|nr:SDR family oxidoreductase [Candidatus Limnocylindrales bacterium]